MMPLVAKLALEWLRAEHAARRAKGEEIASFIPPAEDDDEDPDLMVAADRVYAICAGDVRWSNCSPGDKAIWRGRMRDVEKFEQLWRTDPGPRRLVEARIADEEAADRRAQANYPGPQGRMPTAPDLAAVDDARAPRGQGNRRLLGDGVRNRRWWNWYDTIRCRRTMNPSTYLFGDQSTGGGNIGNFFLTNLQVARRLASDETVVITSFYASVSSLDGLRWGADNVIVQWTMGEMPAGPPMFLRDLFMGIVPLRPIVVPVRQTFYPRVDVRNLDGLHLEEDDLARTGPHMFHRERVEPFDLTIHCEGLITRDTP